MERPRAERLATVALGFRVLLNYVSMLGFNRLHLSLKVELTESSRYLRRKGIRILDSQSASGSGGDFRPLHFLAYRNSTSSCPPIDTVFRVPSAEYPLCS